MSKSSINRRDFLSSAAMIGAAGTLGTGALLTSCGGPKEPALVPLRPEAEWKIPDLLGGVLPDKAMDGQPLKAGLIGCGGRGSGAAKNFLNAGPNLSIVALGDLFPEKAETCRNMLNEKFNQNISKDMCFSGLDAYKKVIDAGVDVLLVATPPVFRPIHFKAIVEAGKHVFLEKPLCVDPVGARSIFTTAKQANNQGLCVMTGTQRHHQRSYIEGYKQVQSGLIGDIVSANIYWNGKVPWTKYKQPNWTDVEWMIQNWVNWCWLSGDHIVEQHVHNIDVFNWFSHLKPVSALGFGARQRRPSGDQYDMFSVDYIYEGGIHVHSMCRQIDGCTGGGVGERIQGTKGVWTNNGVITDLKGNELWKYDAEKEKAEFKQTDEFTLEHVNWVNHIRSKKPINHAEATAISSLTAIMGRMSSYTGRLVTWDEVMSSDLELILPDLTFRNLDMTKFPVPVPGVAPTTEQKKKA